MSNAIRIHAYGGPEQLRWEEVPAAAPGPGEVLLRQSAVGVNFYDVYTRTGLYPMPLPGGIGIEAAGVITALGKGVRGLRVGERVAYCSGAPGSYCEERVMSAGALVKIPPSITDEQAAALMLKGLTAWYLLRETYRVKRGDVILLPAAAGGVGVILSQWARALGARVIGVVGSSDKVALAKKFGCHHVIVGYEGMAAAVRQLTRGQGVDVVYDGVGRDTLLAGLDCLKPRHLMVSFGNASGPAPPVAPLELMRRGSLFLTRPTSGDYLKDPAARRRGARELFALVRSRKVRILIGQRFPLREAARAHAELEARRTTGAIVLLP
jgi:NADPH2:quinone reductase